MNFALSGRAAGPGEPRMRTDILFKLYDYVKRHDYSGYDPYDGLSSGLFRGTVFYRNEFCKLFWIQFIKALPVNLRPLLRVPEGFNPKGGALFMLALMNLYEATGEPKYLADLGYLYDRMLACSIATARGTAFGYNFEWKARAFTAPAGTPSAVATVYAGKALLRYRERLAGGDASIVDGIKDFFLSEMIGLEDAGNLCFRYVPGEDARIHNVNLLTAAFLSEYARVNGDPAGLIKSKVEKAVNFSVSDINGDLSWPYGTLPHHRWVDNFHTAYNIEALLAIFSVFPDIRRESLFKGVINRYMERLFDRSGNPRYYENKLYPIDSHVLAETKVLLSLLKGREEELGVDRDRLKVINSRNDEWIERFFSPEGYFYYRKHRFFWNRIPYMRWSQAWMFYAISTDLALGRSI